MRGTLQAVLENAMELLSGRRLRSFTALQMASRRLRFRAP